MLFWLNIIVVFALKIHLVTQRFYFVDAQHIINLIINDLVVTSLICFLYMLSTHGRMLVKVVLRSVSFILLSFFVLDIILLIFLNTRLYFSDIFKFYDQLLIFPINITYLILIGLIAYLIILVFAYNYNVYSGYNLKYISSSLLILIVSSTVSELYLSTSGNASYNKSVRDNYFSNYLYVNYSSTYKIKYSEEFKKEFTYKPYTICHEREQINPDNIILILVESWSNYHSLKFGGNNNWTEKLDKLASENIKFNNFYSNGYTTEGGLFSLFTGYPLLPYGSTLNLSGGIGLVGMNSEISLVKNISELGYKPTFITSGNLDFLGKNQWLEQMGFKKIIGNEFFPEENRIFNFDSVSDGELVEAVKKIAKRGKNNFYVIENVGTHAPFIYPEENGEIRQSEMKAFIYSDKHLANLIDYFNNGKNLIFVVSDHRAMNQITSLEREKSGEIASAHVPAFAIWDGLNFEVNENIQQTDIINSIINSLKGESCHGTYLGSIIPFDNVLQSECIVHARGDNRSLVTLKCSRNNTLFNIKLDGDDTNFVKENSYYPSAVELVNYLRMKQAGYKM
ncbi:LTA synthase family protein [Vibrio breoganii]|nr:LTA synthase family protein [Vibrio breoganii]PMI17903.1 hypothetical protein BCU49_13080 [Vibrio breoganii]